MKNFILSLKERRLDPRVLQIAAVGTYAVLAHEISSFERPHLWTFLVVIWGIILDLAVGKWIYKKTNFPYTPIVAGVAVSLLIDSPYLWIYLIAVTFAILSKAFITYKGKHLLNPANSGVVFALLLFPGMVSGIPVLFGLHPTLIGIFCVVGIIVASYARVLQIALLWILSFAFFAALRSVIGGAPIGLAFLPMLAPTFFLYSFHMITDPATTPRTLYGRFIFVFSVAALDTLIRMRFIPFSNLYALVAVSLVYHALAGLKRHGVKERNFGKLWMS